MWQRFYQHQLRWIVLFLLVHASINSLIQGASVYDDFVRRGNEITIWQPYLWEFSSNLMVIALIPFILFFDRRFSLNSEYIKRNLVFHLLFSVVFSLLHVGGMVSIREAGYLLMNSRYEYGQLSTELIYEYRKDLMGYIGILAAIYSYRFILSRLIGEASVISMGEMTPEPQMPERLLVKKLGKEFIVKVSDIDWIEAGGNYMNLHIDGRVYPLRETMANLEKRLDSQTFARVHRSFMVNVDRIAQIEPLDSGDFKLHLKCGNTLNFSRRYRENVKALLSL